MKTPITVGHVGWSPDYKSTPKLPVTGKPIARPSAAACFSDDLRVRDADAVEVFIADKSGRRYIGSNFTDIEAARAWLTLQPNRASLRVAITAKFILGNDKMEQPPLTKNDEI